MLSEIGRPFGYPGPGPGDGDRGAKPVGRPGGDGRSPREPTAWKGYCPRSHLFPMAAPRPSLLAHARWGPNHLTVPPLHRHDRHVAGSNTRNLIFETPKFDHMHAQADARQSMQHSNRARDLVPYSTQPGLRTDLGLAHMSPFCKSLR